ncbi:ABC transporter ATP-binding protein/permease [Paraburkholderia caballeronis]|uniref:ABC transporter ATP-binding protein/permease n=1 Tax=Paraburkholderia caballeronis TaxID=416943 RepID=UPI001FB8ADDC|nr:ABC transporter ATP-binding protein/permease [Paraburkholderia caballeronis]
MKPSSPLSASSIVPPGGTLRAAGRLAFPILASRFRWPALSLLAVCIGLTFVSNQLLVELNAWHGRFMDAVQAYNAAVMPSLGLELAAVMVGIALSTVLENLSRSTLEIGWRRWLTERLIDRWLSNGAFYRIERDQLVDNPDQRISQDVDHFVSHSYSLSIGLVGAVVSFVSFSSILWSKSGPADFTVLGWTIVVPGYMFWVALLYAFATSCLVHWVGRPMMRLNFAKERAEADCRFMMTGVREYAEQIALYGGAPTESRRLRRGFDAVWRNSWQIAFFNLRFFPLNTVLMHIAVFVPTFAVLPRYLSHAVTLGDMAMMASAFSTLVLTLSWFITNYQALQNFRVIVARLDGLDRATAATGTAGTAGHATDGEGIAHAATAGRGLTVTGLTLTTPAGRTLARDLSFTLAPGERWLVRGPSGTGKSTLVRALAGIWPYGSGTVRIPDGASLLFLSQKNYLPPGSLRAALSYPSSDDAFSDAQCRDALMACQLAHYCGQLDEHAPWGHRMSPGEQQRLAIARVLLQRPDYLLMDESTSALDAETELHLYALLIERLPDTTLFSVSHHPALDVFHTHVLHVHDGRSARNGSAQPAVAVPLN